MSYSAGKTSSYKGAEMLLNLDMLNAYFRDIDKDLQHLFRMSSPIYQFGKGSQYEYLQAQGDNTWDWASTIGGWNITADTLYAGATSTYIGLKPGTGIWLGNETFASAPFSVDPAGVVHAHSGRVGGWYLGTTQIKSHATSATADVVLDQSAGTMRVGDTDASYILIDGANRQISTSDYASGALGSGWGITTSIAEFQNIRARGKIISACFEYDVISAVGGNFLVCDSDILNADMTAADASTLTISGDTTFAVNDILRIRDGVSDEWFTVTNIGSAPTYTVTRDRAGDYGADANPIWKKGTTVVNYGASGEGLIFMTASEANAPHIDVLTHAGAPWTTTTTRMRMGNLNGFLDYAADAYGIAIGESSAYLKYDPTNGLRIKGIITAESGSTSAGIDSYTKLLIHFDGIDARTAYIAETGQTVTFEGTAQIDTAQKKFGASSLLLDGDSDYITLPDSADWDFGAGDFTIDCWVYPNTLSVGAYNGIISSSVDTSNGWSLVAQGNGKITWYNNAGGGTTASGLVMTTGSWQHIAVVRDGNTLKFFKDGIMGGTTLDVTGDSIDGDASALRIGAFFGGVYLWDGWIDEVRISKGIARWTSDFTVPAGAYADSSLSIAESWAHSSDITLIDGGNIYANTIVLAGVNSEVTDRMFDTSAKSDNIQNWAHASDATLIDGGDIYTNSIIVAGLASTVTDRMWTDSTTKTNIEAWKHASDVTKIDGGNIYTNTVTATQINVSQLDALTVNTGTLTVDEYINAGSYLTIDGANEVFKVFSDTITIETGVNDKLDWIEEAATKVATVTASTTYTPTTLAAHIQVIMRAQGDANTTVTYSSSTKKITIANATLGTFTLKWSTGTNTATTCGRALGFDITADDSGALTYAADYQAALRVELGKI